MTKIWCRAGIEEEYTEARILSKEWFKLNFSVFDCEPVSGPFPDIVLELIWAYPPADFFEPGTLFTVSDRLKSVLEEFEVRAEFFPLEVISQGKEFAERSFYFCNILDCVECFDYTEGEYEFSVKSGQVDKILKLALDEKKTTGHDLFRIANGGECVVCVSDRVASRMIERQFTGLRLVDPNNWRYGCAPE